jgi:MFS family permease
MDIFFLTRNLHASSHMYGYLGTADGLGAIAGAILAGSVVRRLTARTTLWLGLLAGGILFALFARQTAFVPGLITLFALAVPIGIINTALSPLVLAAASREYMGRVVAVFNPIQQLASMLSVVVAGWLASTALRNFHATVAGLHVGTYDTIFTVVGVLILAAGGYALVALPAERPAPQAATA